MQAARKRSGSKDCSAEMQSEGRPALADASNRAPEGKARGAAPLRKFECGVQSATLRKFKKPRRVAH